MIDFEPDIAKLSGAQRQVAARRLLAAVQSGSTTPNTDAAKALGVHKSVMTQIRRHVREACGEGSELHKAFARPVRTSVTSKAIARDRALTSYSQSAQAVCCCNDCCAKDPRRLAIRAARYKSARKSVGSARTIDTERSL